MTKQIDSFQGQEKEYTGTIVLGSTTPSFDLETEINETFQTQHITEALIHETTKQFIGNIQQFPPIFSAVKKNGRRLYEFARAGEHVEIKLREVNISEFAITKIDLPEVQFRVVCSKGTYIRSLAHDFGKALNSGAHLSVLRRTKIGEFSVEKAIAPDAFLESLKD
jgi:tRNA pseudouridine55 synthase